MNEYGYTPRQYRPHHLNKDDPGISDHGYESLDAKNRIVANLKFLDKLRQVYGDINDLADPKNVPAISVIINRDNKNLFKNDAECIYEIYKLFDLTNPNN